MSIDAKALDTALSRFREASVPTLVSVTNPKGPFFSDYGKVTVSGAIRWCLVNAFNWIVFIAVWTIHM